MKTYEEMDAKIHVFLTSALLGDEWSASRPGRFTPGEEPLVPIGGSVGPRTGLDEVKKRKFLTLQSSISNIPQTTENAQYNTGKIINSPSVIAR
jgi:hypothetical protein